MASPAPLAVKKSAARSPSEASPLSRAAAAAAALNDDLQDVPARAVASNPPPTRMLSLLDRPAASQAQAMAAAPAAPAAAMPLVAAQLPSRSAITAASDAAAVIAPPAPAAQPTAAVMEARHAAPVAPAAPPPQTVAASAVDIASASALADARAELTAIRAQLCVSECKLQEEVRPRLCFAERPPPLAASADPLAPACLSGGGAACRRGYYGSRAPRARPDPRGSQP